MSEPLPTLKDIRIAIAHLHWEELNQKRPDGQWIKALEAAGRTMKRLEDGRHG